jgi:predicted AlkP superfamily pyrophosphatase or phosphodiesterase
MNRLLCLLFCLIVASCAAPAPRAPATAPAHTVLLVSIDGYRADYLQRHLSPTLQAMAADGVHAPYMTPSFPSLTFPNHYALVTGKVPDHHGVVNNTMRDSTLGRFSMSSDAARDGRWWDGAEPVWVTIHRAGLRSGTMFWPGTEAEIRGVRPDYYLRFDGKKTPDQRVDQVLAWLGLPTAQRPQFLTLYFDGVDHQGHLHGPDSPEVNNAIVEVDQAMARLIAGLRQRRLFDNLDIVVVSDHGMAATPASQVLFVDDIVDPATVDVVATGTLAGFDPREGSTFAAPSAKLLARHEHMQCWRKADIPPRLNYGTHVRVPAIVCLLDDGWQITTRASFAARTEPLSLGQHGYDNADPHMRALFVAHGPSFRRGVTVAPFANVDVYFLLMKLLGVPAQPGDGSLVPLKPALMGYR